MKKDKQTQISEEEERKTGTAPIDTLGGPLVGVPAPTDTRGWGVTPPVPITTGF